MRSLSLLQCNDYNFDNDVATLVGVGPSSSSSVAARVLMDLLDNHDMELDYKHRSTGCSFALRK